MAGYIFNLNSIISMRQCITRGLYSTKVKPYTNNRNSIINRWHTSAISTLGDYMNMKPGENVYFFHKRMIYGIGELVPLIDREDRNKDNYPLYDCKFLNYPQANTPGLINDNNNIRYEDISNYLIWDDKDWGRERELRWICTFKPSPFFFNTGVDMDEVLQSSPNKFISLPNNERLSFIKIDKEENEALKDIIISKNKSSSINNVIQSKYTFFHNRAKNKMLSHSPKQYTLSPKDILNKMADSQGKLSNEMAIEVGLLYQLANKLKKTISIFGNWDVISHQMVASPKKPKIYMDSIDIFGYKYDKFNMGCVTDYLIIEVKQGTAKNEYIDQLLKYVDWISRNKCANTYPITAFLVAHKIPASVKDYANSSNVKRTYIQSYRPEYKSSVWHNIRLIEYSYNHKNLCLDFIDVTN